MVDDTQGSRGEGDLPDLRGEPEPDWVEAYARGYDRFRALYPALRPLEDT